MHDGYNRIIIISFKIYYLLLVLNVILNDYRYQSEFRCVCCPGYEGKYCSEPASDVTTMTSSTSDVVVTDSSTSLTESKTTAKLDGNSRIACVSHC